MEGGGIEDDGIGGRRERVDSGRGIADRPNHSLIAEEPARQIDIPRQKHLNRRAPPQRPLRARVPHPPPRLEGAGRIDVELLDDRRRKLRRKRRGQVVYLVRPRRENHVRTRLFDSRTQGIHGKRNAFQLHARIDRAGQRAGGVGRQNGLMCRGQQPAKRANGAIRAAARRQIVLVDEYPHNLRPSMSAKRAMAFWSFSRLVA